jgi:tricorn protease-like protein
MVADFIVDASGKPGLFNARDITPAGGVFVEAHGFSPDGKKVLFASDMGNSDSHNMDIWVLDLTSGTPTKLTPDTNWDEHGTYSPGGKNITYMAGELGVWSWSTDLMMVNADGTNKRRLTAFNHAGQPGYTGELTMVARPTWNRDGTRMAVTEQLANGYPSRRRLWVLDFAGACADDSAAGTTAVKQPLITPTATATKSATATPVATAMPYTATPVATATAKPATATPAATATAKTRRR